MKYKQWNIKPLPEKVFDSLRNQGVPPLVAAVLCSRGLDTLEKAQTFLAYHTGLLCDPMGMKDMDKAISRIRQALDRKENIVVYGDYDVDGITSTCLLTHYLRAQGGNVTFYIPDRLEEGYGMNKDAVQALHDQGVSLIVTVDCGITACEEITFAKTLGIDVIVTDHHECKDSLPPALAVVDPHRRDDTYPFKDLAGVGVALKLVLALGGPEKQKDLITEYADLTAVGTVADVMKLLGENRTLVHIGLKCLERCHRPGLRALMKEAGTTARGISSTTVGYCLAPRINAAGRMGWAGIAAEMILTDDCTEAFNLAKQLCDLNRERQTVESDIFNECLAKLEGEETRGSALVLADESWHQGVVGIVASRLAERCACPVFMICLQDGKGKGSCRSYGGFNLFQALEGCADLLEGYGGHALAAGFTILEENIPAFRARINQFVAQDTGGEEMISTLDVDAELIHSEFLNLEDVEQLNLLEPYGAGNPKPIFSLTGVTITSLTDVGCGRHLKLRGTRDGRIFDTIFFSATTAQCGLTVGDRADLAFYPQINEYKGSHSVQLHLVDVRPSLVQPRSEIRLYERFAHGDSVSAGEAGKLIPDREEFVAIWRYVSAQGGRVEETPARFTKSVAQFAGRQESPAHTLVCLDVFRECGLLRISRSGGRLRIQTGRQERKTDLEQTNLMKQLRALAAQ